MHACALEKFFDGAVTRTLTETPPIFPFLFEIGGILGRAKVICLHIDVYTTLLVLLLASYTVVL